MITLIKDVGQCREYFINGKQVTPKEYSDHEMLDKDVKAVHIWSVSNEACLERTY